MMSIKDTSNSIYRFKFSATFQEKLVEFAKIHKFDDPQTFQKHWKNWYNQYDTDILNETRRLQNIGYNGDIETKMYKSVRYYFKDKSDKKKAPSKRRVYIPLNRDMLNIIDAHIVNNKHIKPAIAYSNFINDQSNQEIMRIANDEMEKCGLDKQDSEIKIKKTYKNRYYILSKC